MHLGLGFLCAVEVQQCVHPVVVDQPGSWVGGLEENHRVHDGGRVSLQMRAAGLGATSFFSCLLFFIPPFFFCWAVREEWLIDRREDMCVCLCVPTTAWESRQSRVPQKGMWDPLPTNVKDWILWVLWTFFLQLVPCAWWWGKLSLPCCLMQIWLDKLGLPNQIRLPNQNGQLELFKNSF